MSRQQHDIVNDHFGQLGTDQIADGTATTGFLPTSNGDGTATWTAAADLFFEEGDTSTQVRFISPFTTLYDTNDEAYLNLDGGIDMASFTAQRVSIGVNNGDPDTASGSWHQLYGGSGLQFPELSADPSTPFENQTYYNTTSHKLRTYDGTTWHDLW